MGTKDTLASFAAVMLAMTGAAASAATSEPILVDNDLQSAHWTTAFTNDIPLTWDWNAQAVRAQLTIAGMGGTFTTNFAAFTTGCLWRAFAATVPTAEDVYDLTLTFYNGSDAAVGTLSARLAVVTGAFGKAVVDAVADSRSWPQVKTDAVIPYDASFAGAAGATSSQLVIAKRDGAVQTNAFANVAGYYGWKIRNSGWGYGTFDLALTFPGTEGQLSATLTRLMDETVIQIR